MIHTFEDARLSLLQSLVDDVILRKPGTAGRPDLSHPLVQAVTAFARRKRPEDAAPPPAASGGALDVAAACVHLVGELFLAKLERNQPRVDELEAELKESTCDPLWIEAMTEYLEYYGLLGHKNSIPYVRYSSLDDFVVETLPANARVVLIGDWGTGTAPARRLMEQVARKQPDVVLHLGDIYYAGTERETRANFLDPLNEVLKRDTGGIPVYAVPGNHEMYSGGGGYYSMLSQLNPAPPFAPQQAQQASYFCLRSKDGAWQFLGMDTGLHDHDPFDVTTGVTDLDDQEAAWHLDKIERFHARGGRTILLSHHQLFSAFAGIGKLGHKPAGQEAYNPKLLNRFQDVLVAGKVAAWFWGHEHNLCVYEPYGPLEKGRCIGHGGVPVFTAQDPYTPLGALPEPPRLVSRPGGDEVRLSHDADGVYDVGYVLLELNDAAGSAEVSYYQSSDEERPLYSERLG